MNDEINDRVLDARLWEASPEVTSSTEELQGRLRMMISDAELKSQVKNRRVGLIVSSALAAALLLGGASTLPGTTDVFAQSSPVQIQLFEDEYDLPSGAHCEAIFGVFAAADPAAVEFFREYALTRSLVSEADIDGIIADMRANPEDFWISPGVTEPGGYGTKHYNADTEYGQAVERAILNLEADVLVRNGFRGDALGSDSWSEHSCPDAAW